MKLTLIIANLAAAIALYCLGSMALAANRTYAFSVYRELQTQHVLVDRSDYDAEKRLRTIADNGGYYLILSQLGAAVCLVNAITIGFFWRRQKGNAPLKNPSI